MEFAGKSTKFVGNALIGKEKNPLKKPMDSVRNATMKTSSSMNSLVSSASSTIGDTFEPEVSLCNHTVALESMLTLLARSAGKKKQQ